jgi:hypothetical protein
MNQLFDDEVLREMQRTEAYLEGYRAYQDGLSKYDDNPFVDDYEIGGDDWHLYFAWRDGWESAAWDD